MTTQSERAAASRMSTELAGILRNLRRESRVPAIAQTKAEGLEKQRDALVKALRTDQAGNSTFPEFLMSAWQAGVVRYEIDFIVRTVSYFGCHGETYVEAYPAVPG